MDQLGLDQRQFAHQELQRTYPKARLDVVKFFEDLVAIAQAYRLATGRYLQICGELGELYAEIKFGIDAPSARNARF